MVEFLIKTDQGGLNFNLQGEDLKSVLKDAVQKTEEVLKDHNLCFKEGEQIQFQHLVEAFRQDYPGIVDLGDLSDRLQPSCQEEEVKITLVSPDGDHLVGRYRKKQPVGAIKADIDQEYGLDPQAFVVLKDEQGREVDSSIKVGDLSQARLHWAVKESG